MASGRRGEAQRAQNDFLDANPELIDFSTQIEVVKDSETKVFEPQVTTGLNEFTPFSDSFIGIPNEITVSEGISLFGADLYARDSGDGPREITMSKHGFGVTSEDEFYGEEEMHDGGGLPQAPQVQDVDEEEEFAGTREARSINDDELLILEINSPYYGPYGLGEGDGEMMNMGGTELEIGYKVMGGRGTIEVLLYDDELEQIIVHEVEIPRGSRGTEDSFMVDIPEGFAFEGAEIGVDGNLQVAVTEIGYATTFDGMVVDTN